MGLYEGPRCAGANPCRCGFSTGLVPLGPATGPADVDAGGSGCLTPASLHRRFPAPVSVVGLGGGDKGRRPDASGPAEAVPLGRVYGNGVVL